MSISFIGIGQVVNGYAGVTSITGADLTLGTVDESGDSFEDGEWVVLMQMQDDVIGDVTSSASFGDLGTIQNAGIYEIRQIASHTEALGSPTTITLENNPNFTYNFGANSSVQVITFPQFGAPDYTTTGQMVAQNWNGTIGGVLAFHCPGALTLEHDLDANETGFRGAGPNAGGSAGCSGASNYRVATTADFADKGESIYKVSDANYAAGMGKILNGGGGGNSHNGGGGGGANYTSGGDGGPGWPTCSPSAGGLGGIDLQADISVGRVFMGGGGGAGEGNNDLATDGGNGGGIILVLAEEITTGSCMGVTISSNGESITFAGNDGGGGGGAAGSIVFEVNTWSVTGGCPLTVEANGGDGGDVNDGATHGGGGGGGQGIVIYSAAEPTSNVTTTTLNGDGGCDNDSSPCDSQAGSGGGSDNDGVLEMMTGPLPVELSGHEVICVNEEVVINWTTKSEINSDYYLIQRSSNHNNWKNIGEVEAAGNSTEEIDYTFIDRSPLPTQGYYRLMQVDFDGTKSTEFVSTVDCSAGMKIFPNPSEGTVNIKFEGYESTGIRIYNSIGQRVHPVKTESNGIMSLDFNNYRAGTYLIQMDLGGKVINERVVILPE